MIYGNYRTRTFANIFPTYDDFAEFYRTCGVPQVLLSGSDYDGKYDLETIYFLLISEYANSHIMSADENRFKLQVMAKIYESAPVWQRAMATQAKLLRLAEEDVMKGATAIYNHASHPDTAPSTQTLEELEYIDNQNTSKWKKDPVRALMEVVSGLDDTICKKFVDKFKKLFVVVLYPSSPLLYESEGGESL